VLGIGNPGRRYARTRHNVGFEVIDAVRDRWNARSLGKAHHCRLWVARETILGEPETFVNRSGLAARQLCRSFELGPEDLLVVADDVNLPPGRLRLRRRGSAGGHKGLKSILDSLGTDEVPRLRVGVGRPADTAADLVDHVLSPFPAEERQLADEAVRRAAECVEVYLDEGVEAAMNRFNA
jgi:PTH1 family peptidyl-tRNA hydrolase